MDTIDYSLKIDCPDYLCDEEMMMKFVICEECELLFLDTLLIEAFRKTNVQVAT